MHDEHHKEVSLFSHTDEIQMPEGSQAFAFTPGVRREIFDRDGGTCQESGKRYSDGWMVHASHYNHERNENYDEPDNGRILCIEEHIKDHVGRGDIRATQLLIGLARGKGLHTKRFYQEFPYMWDEDQQRLDILLHELGY